MKNKKSKMYNNNTLSHFSHIKSPLSNMAKDINNNKIMNCQQCKSKIMIKIDPSTMTYIYECENGHIFNRSELSIDDVENLSKQMKSNKRLSLVSEKRPHNNIMPEEPKDSAYFCQEHEEKFISYCTNCHKDLCMICLGDHENHEIQHYTSIVPKKRYIYSEKMLVMHQKKKIEQFSIMTSNFIDQIKKELDDVLTLLKDRLEANDIQLKKFDFHKLNYNEINIVNNLPNEINEKIMNFIDQENEITLYKKGILLLNILAIDKKDLMYHSELGNSNTKDSSNFMLYNSSIFQDESRINTSDCASNSIYSSSNLGYKSEFLKAFNDKTQESKNSSFQTNKLRSVDVENFNNNLMNKESKKKNRYESDYLSITDIKNMKTEKANNKFRSKFHEEEHEHSLANRDNSIGDDDTDRVNKVYKRYDSNSKNEYKSGDSEDKVIKEYDIEESKEFATIDKKTGDTRKNSNEDKQSEKYNEENDKEGNDKEEKEKEEKNDFSIEGIQKTKNQNEEKIKDNKKELDDEDNAYGQIIQSENDSDKNKEKDYESENHSYDIYYYKNSNKKSSGKKEKSQNNININKTEDNSNNNNDENFDERINKKKPSEGSKLSNRKKNKKRNASITNSKNVDEKDLFKSKKNRNMKSKKKDKNKTFDIKYNLSSNVNGNKSDNSDSKADKSEVTQESVINENEKTIIINESDRNKKVFALCELKTRNVLCVGEKKGTISLYDTNKFYLIFSIENKHSKDIFYLTELSDGKLLSCGKDGKINIYEFTNCKKNSPKQVDGFILVQTLSEKDGLVGKVFKCIELSNHLLISGDTANVIIWKKNNKNQNYSFYFSIDNIKDYIYSILELNSETFVLYLSRGVLSFYNSKTYEELGKTNLPLSCTVNNKNFRETLANINQEVFAADGVDFIYLISISKMEVIKEIHFSGYDLMNSFNSLNDNKGIIVACSKNDSKNKNEVKSDILQYQINDTNDDLILTTIIKNENETRKVLSIISLQKSAIVTGSDDGTVKVWK